MQKTCSKCGKSHPATLDFFPPDRSTPSGLRANCITCRTAYDAKRRAAVAADAAEAGIFAAAKNGESAAERKQRLDNHYMALKPEDFDTSVGNDGRRDRDAAKEQRQYFSKTMGEYSDALHSMVADGTSPPAEMASYIGKLAEQERRFGNRRLARSVSLLAAQEALNLRLFKQAATEYLSNKITPTGYALKPSNKTCHRKAFLFLSDLHLGSDLSPLDNPAGFGPVEEARRLEFIVRQWFDFKPQHRATTEGVLLLAGDIIDGMLLHDLRDGAPITEQKVVFWKYLRAIIGTAAQVFPKVHIECQPGNHGRDKLRHPGRATSSKWQGHEWEMFWALKEMCSGLPNVTFNIPFQAISTIDVFGQNLLLTHGDTEVKLRDPDRYAVENAEILDRINSNRTYGVEFSGLLFGHFHKARLTGGKRMIIANGALVPPNGHARTSGWIRETCGQWLWEGVEGFPIGDIRFISVGPEQDKDPALGKLVVPFRFEK